MSEDRAGQSQPPVMRLTRRAAIKGGVATATTLALGFDALGNVVHAATAPADTIGDRLFGVWLRIEADGAVTLVSPEVEYGQGTITANAMLVAEELDLDWDRLRVIPSGAARIYTNPSSGRMSTDGSWGTRGRFEQLRMIGAKARVMLVQSAASRWGVPPEQCSTARGVIAHVASGRSLHFGEVASDAMRLPVPPQVNLRAPSQWRLIGTWMPRLDSAQKCGGQARYSVDQQLQGMLHAAIARCPLVWGGTVRAFDDREARARSGVRAVFEVGFGVAVLADDPWTARKAAEALTIEWNEGAAAELSSAGMARDYARALESTPGVRVRNDGDVEAAARQPGARTIRAEYAVPMLAHQCMEPTGATAWAHEGRIEFWSPTASMDHVLRYGSKTFGVAEDQIVVHRAEFVGGSFGLRGRVDPELEAAQLSIRAGGVPVQVLRRREDDVQHGWYRPYQRVRIEATLDAAGKLLAWNHKVAVQSINAHYADEVIPFGVDVAPINEETRQKSAFFRLPIDFYATAGSPHNLSYRMPNLRVTGVQMEVPIPVTHWRSVGFSGNTFVTESMLDELAVAAARDPLDFRRELLAGKPRQLAVLDALGSEAQWQPQPSPARTRRRGTGWGVAFGDGFWCYCAIAAKVSINGERLRVERIVCVYDQGITVNANQTAAQVEGGIVDGLSTALFGGITLERGRVQQSNFHDYRVCTLADMPELRIREIKSSERAGSMTEIVTPAVIPAITNAIYAATGRRLRDLPLSSQGFKLDGAR